MNAVVFCSGGWRIAASQSSNSGRWKYAREDSPRNRYLISPRDLLEAEKAARALGLDIVGVYHSHPDHPARPSEFDREHAFPWYSYIIVSVRGGEASRFDFLDSTR